MSAWLPGRKRPNTAAEWFAARRRGSDAKLERQFREWLLKDPARGEEYALCEISWEASRDAAREMPEPKSRSTSGRAVLPRLAIAFSLAGLSAVIVLWMWQSPARAYETAPGEQRTVVLEDGSRVTLNTRTRMSVRLTRHAREVVLQSGEAFFQVFADASRPFTVRTSLGSARAVGTRFNVYLEEGSLSVTTQEGNVEVDSVIVGNGVLVGAGRHAEIRPGMQRALVEPAELGAALGWLSGQLQADNEPLGEVLKDFSRYTRVRLRADTPSIAALRVSAVLRIGDTEALRAALKGAFGLELERRGDDLVVFDPSAHAAVLR